MPVFTALAADIASDRKVVEQADSEAADILSHAREDASALLSQAQLESRSARAEAAARVAEDHAERDEALLASARDQAEVLARTGTSRLPDMTRAVIERMLADLWQQ